MERYFLEPYRFIPPFRGTLWCRLARGYVVRNLRRKLGVTRWHFEGVDRLRASLEQQAGILLAPNHCRWADPPVLGLLGAQAKTYLYYLASYHLFRQGKIQGWLMNRLGGYSIWREGADRESLKATAAILAKAERPVVLFPEGTWFRQNDRVGPLQDGLTLITRQAARQSTRPIVIHPVGIKYWLLRDPTPEVLRRLEQLERRLGWSPQRQLSVLDRIEKLGTVLMAIKEIEFLGQPQSGSLDERIKHLTLSQVERLERQHLGRTHEGWPLERIRRLRQQLTRKLHELAHDPTRHVPIKKDLDDLLFLENLHANSMEYLRDYPSPERIAETIQRIEETTSDEIEKPLGEMGATVHVGEAIDVRSLTANDALTIRLRAAIQALIDGMLQQGPPVDWGCPPCLPLPQPTGQLSNGQLIS